MVTHPATSAPILGPHFKARNLTPSASRPLADRLVQFAIQISAIIPGIPRDVVGLNLARQLARSGSSPAAHYGEARGAASDRDYVFKMRGCLKELRETSVWLQVARGSGYRNADYAALEKECGELTAIVITCIRKVEGRQKRKGKGNN